MKGDDGRVLVGGFYDGIGPVTDEERAMLASVPDDAEQMLKAPGVAAPERAFATPAGCAAVSDAERPRFD